MARPHGVSGPVAPQVSDAPWGQPAQRVPHARRATQAQQAVQQRPVAPMPGSRAEPAERAQRAGLKAPVVRALAPLGQRQDSLAPVSRRAQQVRSAEAAQRGQQAQQEWRAQRAVEPPAESTERARCVQVAQPARQVPREQEQNPVLPQVAQLPVSVLRLASRQARMPVWLLA